jgi:NodT family efflux transporter outer membrane factor (OMF) lipoprotein
MNRKIDRAPLVGGLIAVLTVFASSCMVGPKYQRPAAPTPQAFKEPPPNGWKTAQPSDGILRGKWWELYNDPDLNALEEQVSISNQNVLMAEAQYRQAKDAIRIARAAFFPTVTVGPGITSGVNSSSLITGPVGGGTRNTFSIPFDFSYQIDVWGSIRRAIRASAETAQSTEAQLENARLLYQSELAQDYFSLHGLDGDEDLLETTVKSYQDYLKLTQDRLASGVASGGDLALAETQLYTTTAQLVDLNVMRTQYEHAIAMLTGKPPSELSIPRKILRDAPPVIPVAVPSALLERRPDVASLERQMASANEQIGIAQAAYYPTISLSASAGLQGSGLLNLFSWPARFWSVGPGLSETLFDAGRRRGVLLQAEDAYDATVANYRLTVLTSFQQVEDALSALHYLEDEATVETKAVDAAKRSLTIATAQYKAGTTDYLTVITTQALALQDERTQVDLLTRRITESVILVQALGGGWDASQMPSATDLIAHAK